ncbi:MAG: hypothetical protein IJS38_00715 [Erysipelotrichaceae bacterium]|nr:hypothetical protein [Erysipelotrichaceae bacterium]
MKKTLLLFVTLLLTLSVFTVPVKALEPETPVDPDEPEEYVIYNYYNEMTGSVYAGGIYFYPTISISGTITYSGSLITDYSLTSAPGNWGNSSNVPTGYSLKLEQISCVFSLNSSNYLSATANYRITITDSSENTTVYTRSYVYSVAH